jgi:hypothetical protein
MRAVGRRDRTAHGAAHWGTLRVRFFIEETLARERCVLCTGDRVGIALRCSCEIHDARVIAFRFTRT